MTRKEKYRLAMEISRNVSDMIRYQIMVAKGEYHYEPFSNLHEAQSRFEQNLLQLIENTP